jgi:hypothetical protein
VNGLPWRALRNLADRLRERPEPEKLIIMRIITWGLGSTLVLGAASVNAQPTTDGDDGDASQLGEEARSEEAQSEEQEEQIGEVVEAATARGTACRSACVGSYTAACLRISYLCTGATVFTLGSTTVPCATGLAAVCFSAAVLAQICSDRCPP